MQFKIGQKVVYPNHGVGTIEKIEQKQIGENPLSFYSLRLAFNNSLVFVPVNNADEVGLRLPITRHDCDTLLDVLSDNFSNVPNDWKIRHREYTEKVRHGDIFAVADVLKKLTFLHRQKSLSFREQRLWEKSRYLIISELAAVCKQEECNIETRVESALDAACRKYQANETAPIECAPIVH